MWAAIAGPLTEEVGGCAAGVGPARLFSQRPDKGCETLQVLAHGPEAAAEITASSGCTWPQGGHLLLETSLQTSMLAIWGGGVADPMCCRPSSRSATSLVGVDAALPSPVLLDAEPWAVHAADGLQLIDPRSHKAQVHLAVKQGTLLMTPSIPVHDSQWGHGRLRTKARGMVGMHSMVLGTASRQLGLQMGIAFWLPALPGDFVPGSPALSGVAQECRWLEPWAAAHRQSGLDRGQVLMRNEAPRPSPAPFCGASLAG